METFDIGLTEKIVIGVVVLACVGFVTYKFATKSKKNNNLPKANAVNNNEIEKKIKNYLGNYKKDCENYELASFYSHQLNIEKLQIDYIKNEKRIIFDEFNFSIQEEEFANGILKKIAEKITGKQYNQQINQSNLWIFLLNYNKLQGKIEALEFINVEHKINEKDIKQFKKFEKENEKRMQELISDFNETVTN